MGVAQGSGKGTIDGFGTPRGRGQRYDTAPEAGVESPAPASRWGLKWALRRARWNTKELAVSSVVR